MSTVRLVTDVVSAGFGSSFLSLSFCASPPAAANGSWQARANAARRLRTSMVGSSVGGLGGLLGDPGIDVALQHRQRQRARAEHHVVEGADVEALAELGGRARAQLLDLQLADLVGQRLARPGDVAVDLVDDVVLGLGRVGLEELDR